MILFSIITFLQAVKAWNRDGRGCVLQLPVSPSGVPHALVSAHLLDCNHMLRNDDMIRIGRREGNRDSRELGLAVQYGMVCVSHVIGDAQARHECRAGNETP